MRRVPSPVAAAGRHVLYVLASVPLAALALATLVGGWTLIAVLSFTPVVVPLLVGLERALRGLATIEALLARELLGGYVPRPAAPARTRGFWSSARRVLSDARFWRRQTFAVLRVVAGFPLAVAEIAVLASGLFLVSAPLTYRWIPQDGGHGFDFGLWRVDTIGEACAVAPLGLAVLALGVTALWPFGALWRRLASALLAPPAASSLTGDDDGWLDEPAARRTVRRRGPSGRGLPRHVAVASGLAAVLVAIWAATTRAYFWPFWAILPLAATVVVHALAVAIAQRDGSLWRAGRTTPALAMHAGVAFVVELVLLAVWAATTRWYFWPIWPALGLAVSVGAHWLTVLFSSVDTLERRRADAVDVQEGDLRRIERDLHDGAQARLVALGMHLGLAEQKLSADPEGARALVHEARQGVGDALAELRDLVRGIRPPVLADRGLEAAIWSLVDRTPLPVDVHAQLDGRPPDSVETAAYFVVAEALTNAAKHAHAERVEIDLRRRGTLLLVDVTDDGRGGADPMGHGLGGLRQRVEALGGTLSVRSPHGGPTIVRAEIPCER